MEDDFADFISHLSDDARLSVQYADAIARGYGNPYIGTEHLLLGILSQSASLGTKVLADAGITLRRARFTCSRSRILRYGLVGQLVYLRRLY